MLAVRTPKNTPEEPRNRPEKPENPNPDPLSNDYINDSLDACARVGGEGGAAPPPPFWSAFFNGTRCIYNKPLQGITNRQGQEKCLKCLSVSSLAVNVDARVNGLSIGNYWLISDPASRSILSNDSLIV